MGAMLIRNVMVCEITPQGRSFESLGKRARALLAYGRIGIRPPPSPEALEGRSTNNAYGWVTARPRAMQFEPCDRHANGPFCESGLWRRIGREIPRVPTSEWQMTLFRWKAMGTNDYLPSGDANRRAVLIARGYSGAQLRRYQLRVQTAPTHQLVVAADLGHPAFRHHDDGVGLPHRR